MNRQPMRGKTISSSLLLVLLGVALGYVAAVRFQPRPADRASNTQSKVIRNPTGSFRGPNSSGLSAGGRSKTLTFTEVSAAFQAALANPKMDKRFEALTDLAESVAVADI